VAEIDAAIAVALSGFAGRPVRDFVPVLRPGGVSGVAKPPGWRVAPDQQAVLVSRAKQKLRTTAPLASYVVWVTRA
jgi:hypothetical protein